MFSFRDRDLRRYFLLSVPVMIGFSIVAVDEWIVKNQASYLGEGILSYLQYGRTMMKVPIGVFGMAAGVATYPTISRLVSAGSMAEAYGLLCRAVRLMLVATFAGHVLNISGVRGQPSDLGPFCQSFHGCGCAINSSDSCLSVPRLGGWAAQSDISLGFYALESIWLPTLVGTAVAVIMVLVYVGLRQQWGAIGPAMSSAIAILTYVEREAAAIGASLDGVSGMLSGALRLALAATAATALGLGAPIVLLQFLPGTDLKIILLRAAVLCVLGIAIYLELARRFGIRDLHAIKRLLRRRLGLQCRTS
jgi:putative peptidoglycan lipid II flippase